MRKFIVPHPEKKGSLKLVAALNPPPEALCEAPESFTCEMEPFFLLEPVTGLGGYKSFSVSVAPSYHAAKAKESQDLTNIEKERYAVVVAAAEKVKRNHEFNKLPHHKRFIKNVFGDFGSVVKSKLRGKK